MSTEPDHRRVDSPSDARAASAVGEARTVDEASAGVGDARGAVARGPMDETRAAVDETHGDTLVRIRAFEWSDYDDVITLWRSVGLRLGVSDEPAGLRRTLARDPTLFLVAERDAAVVGVVLGTFDGRRGWLHHLAVDGAWQGTGIGRQLVERAEGLLRECGCVKVNLHVEPDNTGVVGFYERLGYSVRPIVFMEKWL